MANAWLLRALIPNKKEPEKSINLLPVFLKHNLIAIGWNELEDLTGKSADDIKEAVEGAYGFKSFQLGNAYAVINIFVNKMQIGDLVIVPNGNEIHFARITGNYAFNDTVELSIIPHTRLAEWKGSVLRHDLPDKLRRPLRVLRTAANITKYYDDFIKIIDGSYIDNKTQTIPVEYPLRPEFIVKFSIPKDITANEANRLSQYIATLYFD